MKMEKIWIGQDQIEGNEVELGRLLNISPKIASLLIQRNIRSYEEAFKFFRPDLNNLHDPFMMKGLRMAVQRIHQAISQQENILFFGDYDVDGTTSVSLMYRYFKSFYSSIQFYLPDREKEGYGVSTQGIEWAKKSGVDLIISLDCGIKSIQEIALAKQMGMDFIICDHHLPDDELPPAYAILNPKQKDCPYPFKYLSGCGIAFKFIQGYDSLFPKSGLNPYELLDLVAMSIACDMVEVEDENRILAFHGLKKLNSKPILGIKALLATFQNSLKNSSSQNPNNPIRFQEILFQLGPRINAAGRMGDAHRVVELFITENEEEARLISQDLNEENQKRREIEQIITREALEMIERDQLGNKFTNVLFSPDWHKGLVGIVASRVIEKHYAPTIILTESQGKITGSARSVANFNIYEAIQDCSHLLEQFGGHSAAAGLKLCKENLESFQKEFEEVVKTRLGGESLKPRVYFHEYLDLEEIGPSFYKVLEQFAPFGPSNPVPVFQSRSVRISSVRKINETHLKLELCRKNDRVEAMGFGLGSYLPQINLDTPFDICYQIDWNTYKGNSQIQLLIKDLKPSSSIWQN